LEDLNKEKNAGEWLVRIKLNVKELQKKKKFPSQFNFADMSRVSPHDSAVQWLSLKIYLDIRGIIRKRKNESNLVQGRCRSFTK